MKIKITELIENSLGFSESKKFIEIIEKNDLNSELEKLTNNLFIIAEERAKEEAEEKLEESQDKLFRAIGIIEQALEQIENL